MGGFKRWFDEQYEALKQTPGGKELLAIPLKEEVAKGYATQQGAHPILSWLDPPQTRHAFDALRAVNACGKSGYDDLDEALICFMDLVTTNANFSTPEKFWQNVYKYWLENCSQVMQPMWVTKIKNLAASFNEEYADQGHSVDIIPAVPKTYDQMQATETGAGFKTYEERTASSSNTDVIRCTLVANTTEAMITIVDVLKTKNFIKDKIMVVQVNNEFHPDHTTPDGYREVILNVVFNAGERDIPGTPRIMKLSLIGEIRIALPDFIKKKSGMSLLRKYSTGKMEPQLKG